MKKLNFTRNDFAYMLILFLIVFAGTSIPYVIDNIQRSARRSKQEKQHAEMVQKHREKMEEEQKNINEIFEKSMEEIDFEELDIEEEKELIEKVKKNTQHPLRDEITLKTAVKAGWADEEVIENGEFYNLVRELAEDNEDMYDFCLVLKHYDFIPEQVRDSSVNIAIRMFVDKYGYQLK